MGDLSKSIVGDSPEIRKSKDVYRKLRMVRDRLNGDDYETIGQRYGHTPRNAKRIIKTLGWDMIRQAMEQTKGDPEHPGEKRFTLDDFNTDSKRCMAEITGHHIEQLEGIYGFSDETLAVVSNGSKTSG